MRVHVSDVDSLIWLKNISVEPPRQGEQKTAGCKPTQPDYGERAVIWKAPGGPRLRLASFDACPFVLRARSTARLTTPTAFQIARNPPRRSA